MKFPLNPHRPLISRRTILKGLSFAPLMLKPAPILGIRMAGVASDTAGNFSLADIRLAPHYPSQSPLTDIFRLVQPGLDDFPLEKTRI